MRSIFAGDAKQIGSVYSDEICEKLKKTAGLNTGKVFSKTEILESVPFINTEYIFSTWGMPAFEKDEIKRLFPALKAVFYAAGTVQSFARPFLECGIAVFSAWAANAVPVAEFTVSQIILANKNFFAASRLMSIGKSGYKEIKSQIHGNYEAKIGIIGAGMIGKLVIQMLKAYNVEIFVFDPFLDDGTATLLGVKKVELSSIFSKCNVVSNHLANNAQTKGMLTYEHFCSLPLYATFINTGRGAQVIEEDLAKALYERPDLTALLDVTYPEPPAENHPFYTLPNCILSPHIAGSLGKETRRMAEFMANEYLRFSDNKPCSYNVTLEMLDVMA